MNGDDIKHVEQVFGLQLKPLVAAVEDLSVKSEKHYKEIIIMKTKFKAVGNCAQHAAKVEAVEREI